MSNIKTPQEMFEEKQKSIKDAINAKEKSIAYFNSVNSSIQMALANKSLTDSGEKKFTDLLVEWRDWFYEKWEEWYLEKVVVVLKPADFTKVQSQWNEKKQEAYNLKSAQDEVATEEKMAEEKLPIIET
jgi:hypothetical protein